MGKHGRQSAAFWRRKKLIARKREVKRRELERRMAIRQQLDIGRLREDYVDLAIVGLTPEAHNLDDKYRKLLEVESPAVITWWHVLPDWTRDGLILDPML